MKNKQRLTGKPSKAEIIEQLERIKKSKVLGRSIINGKLLDFLVNYALNSLATGDETKSPKEFEIATKALDKADDFNPAEDASIRVYVSNLRKKLETYYQTEGVSELFHISIPTGGYGLKFNWVTKQERSISNIKTNDKKRYWYVGGIVISVLLNVMLIGNYLIENNWKGSKDGLFQDNPQISGLIDQQQPVRQHRLWQPLFSSAKPTLIVIGDLYMLTEVDPHTQLFRAVREFNINSDLQFEDYLNRFPEKRTKINKASSAFLLKNSVFSLQHLLPLFTEKSPATIKLSSELTPTDLREHNIVYLGLYKSLGLLDAYLQGSNFEISAGPNSLKHKGSLRGYNVTGNLEQEYTDYGSFAQFSGPSGNHFYIFTGFSDASVIQMAKYLTSQTRLASTEFTQHFDTFDESHSNFEMIFSAYSFDRTDLDSNLVDSGVLDIKSIWSMPK